MFCYVLPGSFRLCKSGKRDAGGGLRGNAIKVILRDAKDFPPSATQLDAWTVFAMIVSAGGREKMVFSDEMSGKGLVVFRVARVPGFHAVEAEGVEFGDEAFLLLTGLAF